MKRAAIGLVALLAAGCGLREPLQPPPGESLPVAPMAAREAPTPERLLTPPPIARPMRVDELLRRSEPREDDRFDMPPPDVPQGANPVPIPAEQGPEPE